MSDNLPTIDTTVAKSTCCTCGFSWPTGRNGSHLCAEYLRDDAMRYRKLKSFALPKYVIRMKSGDTPSLYREGDVIVDCGSWDVLDKALIDTAKAE